LLASTKNIFVFFVSMKIEEIHSLFLSYPNISTDTRNIIPNSIFFALKGANFNGNKFAQEAIEKGAAYSVIDENEFTNGDRIIIVEDVLKCLQELATFHRKFLNIPVIGITGSNGKTTTKELVQRVLSKKFNVFATKGNLNNHIGVPLTLLSLNKEHEMAIVEMGANHQGEIAFLSNICLPNYGLITNIGKAHLEGFGGIEGVIKGKTELYKFIRKNDGLLFANGDDELLMKVSGGINKITYGENENNYLIGKLIDSEKGLCFTYSSKNLVLNDNNETPIYSVLNGRYNFQNILASVCIGNYFNVSSDKIKEAIENYVPQNNRSQIEVRKGITFFMDAYNANPSSMEVSINNFDDQTKGKTRIAIIGGMNELGESTKEEHQKLIKQLEEKKFNKVFLVGQHFKDFSILNSFEKVEKIENITAEEIVNKFSGCFILVKGSRTNQLENILNIF
jgi:UDP-N-acetylmuramoyl-tripeptide--D-alanyl-D-alanine ligase